MTQAEALRLAGILALALVGSLIAVSLGLPMPFLLGSLVFTAGYAMVASAAGLKISAMPETPRRLFIALIGTMIGATFTRELADVIPSLWVSMLAMVAFVIMAQALGFLIYRKLAGYDPVTAYFASMPGGLIEAIELGRGAGANNSVLSLQHFARVVLVVIFVPLLFWGWTGDAVGSAGGQSLSVEAWRALDVLAILVIALAGMWIGPRFRLPAGHMTGPLLLSGVLHVAGIVDVVSPDWLLAIAQLAVGAGLGTNFAGTTLRQLGRSFGFGTITVLAVLALSLGFALILTRLTPISTEALFISFAPGGVTEMGLIALSLSVSPVVVATHHVFRIMLTVVFAGITLRRGWVG